VSKKSVFDGRKPIRGGIPVVFPQAEHHAHRICSIKRLSRENSKNIDDHKYGLCIELITFFDESSHIFITFNKKNLIKFVKFSLYKKENCEGSDGGHM
jgi:hypothetical protein